MSLYNIADYHFTRHGMFAYKQDDTKRTLDNIKNQRKADSTNFNFEKLLQNNTNPIQKRVIKLLRPIAKKIPDQFIDGALTVWLKKSLLGNNVDINRSYEKIIQMLISVYQASENTRNGRIDFIMPVYTVIQSMIKYIQDSSTKKKIEVLVNCQKWTKNNAPLNFYQTSSETLLCSFLYSYLVYNPTMYDPLFEKRPEDKTREFHKIYIAMIKYFNVFKLSRNPFTICWLLEILNIVSLKFK